MTKIISTLALATTVLMGCGSKSQKITNPWEAINVEKLSSTLLKSESKKACEIIDKSKKTCEELVKTLEKKTDFVPVDAQGKGYKYKLISNVVVNTSDSNKFGNRKVIYHISSKVSKSFWVIETVIFNINYNKEKGYDIKFSSKQYMSESEWI